MAPRSTARRTAVAALLMVGWLLPAGVAAAGPVPSPTAVAPGEAWWVPVGLRGQPVSTVSAVGAQLTVTSNGRSLRSTDGGHTFVEGPGPASAVAARDDGSKDRWVIENGTVLHSRGGHPWTVDPGAPPLGGGASLIAAPAALPGVVVVVATDGTVWRRSAGGGWGQSLLLLPGGIAGSEGPLGIPHITALAAFAGQPLTPSVYLGVDGYGVLSSGDGGDDWIRASPDLPDGVLALAADAESRALYAGTRDGLWVHHLRPLPAPPHYADQQLTGRQIGTALITVAAAGLGIVAMAGAVRPRRGPIR